jgi:hypothetical protein
MRWQLSACSFGENKPDTKGGLTYDCRFSTSAGPDHRLDGARALSHIAIMRRPPTPDATSPRHTDSCDTDSSQHRAVGPHTAQTPANLVAAMLPMWPGAEVAKCR